jgi:hypothetical protein
MSRSDPPLNDHQTARDSSRDGFVVRDELPADLPILEEELLWLTDLLATLLSPGPKESPDND